MKVTMTTARSKNAVGAFAPLFICLAGSTVADAKTVQCFEDWSVASRIVAQERLVSVEDLSGRLVKPGRALIRTTLCREHGRYVYRVLLRDRHGNIGKLTVDAERLPAH